MAKYWQCLAFVNAKPSNLVTFCLRGDITGHHAGMPTTEHQKRINREKQRRWRERQRNAKVVTNGAPVDRDDDPADPESGQLSPAGLVDVAMVIPKCTTDESADAESGEDYSGDLMREQARWVYERRLLTVIERRRRLGELIQVDDAKAQSAALARRIRAALNRAASHLPADLSPEQRSACSQALATAIKQALANL